MDCQGLTARQDLAISKNLEMINNKKLIFGLTLGVAIISIGVLFLIKFDFVSDTSIDASCISRTVTDEVRGDSLSPLLKDGNKVKIQYGFYSCNPLKRGDLVIYNYPGNDIPLIKIAKAIPGDSFTLIKTQNGWNIIVNGEVLENSEGMPYSISDSRRAMLALYEKDYKGIIPPEAILVLGDRPEGTLDSTQFGLISVKDILGRAEAVR